MTEECQLCHCETECSKGLCPECSACEEIPLFKGTMEQLNNLTIIK